MLKEEERAVQHFLNRHEGKETEGQDRKNVLSHPGETRFGQCQSNKSEKLVYKYVLQQYQSTYLRGQESASTEIPPYRPHKTAAQCSPDL